MAEGPRQNRIDLAHEPDFAIGPLHVFPSTRDLARDGERQVIEPRVMQVLIALHRAGGAVVSKDDLAQSCWEGRVVGEDAINRVLSRLRKLAETIARGAFRIETVTRVGYRMIADGAEIPKTVPVRKEIGRRGLILAGGAAILAGSGYWLARQAGGEDDLSPGIADLLRRGQEAMLYGTPEQTAQGISLFQQATAQAPDSARSWGLLALAYAQQAQQSRPGDFERLAAQSDSAARRALDLDPDNAEATVSRIVGPRQAGGRESRDKALRQVLARHPDNPYANRSFAFLLSQVGRVRESVPYFERAIAAGPYSPVDGYAYAVTLWSLLRLDEADAAMERTFRLSPRHYGVWFSRYKHFAYTGRIPAARAMLDDTGQRPTGIPEANFDLCATELRALASRSPPDIAAAQAAHLAAARTGVGFAQNAMTFAAATGDGDAAFAIAQAMYFDRGFTIGPQRFSREQGLFNPARRRPTFFLFTPPFSSMWRDPRFDSLCAELGLADYWKATGSTPDFRLPA